MAVKPSVARGDEMYAGPGAGGACWAAAVVTPGPDWT